jgi:hypothetical protein
MVFSFLVPSQDVDSRLGGGLVLGPGSGQRLVLLGLASLRKENVLLCL